MIKLTKEQILLLHSELIKMTGGSEIMLWTGRELCNGC